jgi:hypothetical protein
MGSNHQPQESESCALPIELLRINGVRRSGFLRHLPRPLVPSRPEKAQGAVGALVLELRRYCDRITPRSPGDPEVGGTTDLLVGPAWQGLDFSMSHCDVCGRDCEGTSIHYGYKTACLGCAAGMIESMPFPDPQAPPAEPAVTEGQDIPTWITRLFGTGIGT